MNCHRSKDSSLPVALAQKPSVSSSMAATSWARVAVRGGAPRNPPAWLKKPVPAGRELSLAARELLAARAVRDRRRDITCFGWLVVQAWRMAAHLGDFLLRLSCQLCRQRRCSRICHFALPSLGLSLLSTRRVPRLCMHDTPSWARASSRTTCTHASVPIMRTSAPRTTLAWMKMTSPVGTFPKLKPLSMNPLSTTSFTTLVLSARASGRLASRSSSFSWECSLLQPRKPSHRHIRLHVELPFPTHQEVDHSVDLAQVLSPIHDSLLLCRGLEV